MRLGILSSHNNAAAAILLALLLLVSQLTLVQSRREHQDDINTRTLQTSSSSSSSSSSFKNASLFDWTTFDFSQYDSLGFVSLLKEPTFLTANRFLSNEELSDCRDNLQRSDENDDSVLDADEYSYFIDLQSDGEIDMPFSEMRLVLIATFYGVACDQCYEETESDDCCVGDSAEIVLKRSEEDAYAETTRFLCSTVQQAIDELLGVLPTEAPSVEVTEMPTLEPSEVVTEVPTLEPSEVVTEVPTEAPSSVVVTEVPTLEPSEVVPTASAPTDKPTRVPTTAKPTGKPTRRPNTAKPTGKPTRRPTTAKPTSKPTRRPTTAKPTGKPTRRPTTVKPTTEPSLSVNVEPTAEPSLIASDMPSLAPSSTVSPSDVPSHAPSFSVSPSDMPSEAPSSLPTAVPELNTTCVTFYYSVQNAAGFTAEDILTENGNTLKSGLEIATFETMLVVLNGTDDKNNNETSTNSNSTNQRRVLTTTTSRLTAAIAEQWQQLWSSPSSSSSSTIVSTTSRHAPHRRRTQEEIQKAVDAVVQHYYDVGSARAMNMAMSKFYGMMDADNMLDDFLFSLYTPARRRQQDSNGRRQQKRRRRLTLLGLNQGFHRQLAYATEDLMPNITDVIEDPFCPRPDNFTLDCAIIVTEACVVLEPGDDEKMVQAMLLDGIQEALDSGAFFARVPPENTIT